MLFLNNLQCLFYQFKGKWLRPRTLPPILKITCHNHHHLAVCEARYNAKPTSLQLNTPAFQPLQQQISTIAPPLAPQNNSLTTYTVSTNTPKSVLLQTAIASINGVYCRLLFDTGSQLSYISPSLFKKLNLKSEGTQQFQLNVFGANYCQKFRLC